MIGRGNMRMPIVHACESSEAGLVLDIQIPAGLEYFDGHFPGYPVVPGVVQLKWVMDFCRQYLEKNTECKRVEVLKFNRVIGPDARLRLTLNYKQADKKLYFIYESEGAVHSSGRVVLE